MNVTEYEDDLFKEGLLTGSVEKINTIPKADVHAHLLLSLPFAKMRERFGEGLVAPPSNFTGLDAFNTYIYTQFLRHIKTAADYEYCLEEALKAAIVSGVSLFEASIDSQCYLAYQDHATTISRLISIKEKFNRQITFLPELGINKMMAATDIEDQLIPFIDSGFFTSIDIYGDETVDDFEKFQDVYIYAKQKGLKLKAHAGEFSDSSLVKKAIDILAVDELQHGIRVVTDENLLDEIKERGIRLNICPSSNVILGSVPRIEEHPIKTLFNKGVSLSINSDDLVIFNRTVSEEYLYLYQNNVLGIDELNVIRKMGLTGSSQQ